MASSDQRDPPKDLEDLLGQHGVDPTTISSMMSEGWSLSTFALSATTIDAFDPLMFDSKLLRCNKLNCVYVGVKLTYS